MGRSGSTDALLSCSQWPITVPAAGCHGDRGQPPPLPRRSSRAFLTGFCLYMKPVWCLLSSTPCRCTEVNRLFDFGKLDRKSPILPTDEQKLDIFLKLSYLCVMQTDYYYQYTECDSTGSRWRVAIPLNPGVCSDLPPPTRGTDCCRLHLHAPACLRVHTLHDCSFLFLQLSPAQLACS